jgi:hypothetical protein
MEAIFVGLGLFWLAWKAKQRCDAMEKAVVNSDAAKVLVKAAVNKAKRKWF